MLQSLLLTGLGGVLGITGTLLASQLQARNARQVRAEQYTREDRYRLATNRIDAYTAFYKAAGRARSAMAIHAHPEEGECDKVSLDDMRAARNAVWDSYTLVGLIGDNATERHASAVLEFVTNVSQHRVRFINSQWAGMMKAYIHAARFEVTLAEDRYMPGSVPVELRLAEPDH